MTTLRDMPMISVEQKNAFREAALKVEAERDRLKVELENRSHEPDMTASDAYHHCADLIEPHVVGMPHGTECNEQSLCRSVCGSLAYLIAHWREARGLREERDQMAAQLADLTEAAENATGILCGENLAARNNPLELMAKKVVGERDALAAALEGITRAARREDLHIRGWGDQVRTAVLALGGSYEHLARRAALVKAEALEEARSICIGIERGQLELSYKYTEIDGDGDEMVVGTGVDYGNKAMGAGHCRERIAELIAEYREQAATEAMDAIDGEDGDFANVRGVVERMIAAGYRKQAEGNGDE